MYKNKCYNCSGGDRNTALMEIEVPITTCKKIQGLKSVIDDRVLCAGNPEGDADSCQVFSSFLST